MFYTSIIRPITPLFTHIWLITKLYFNKQKVPRSPGTFHILIYEHKTYFTNGFSAMVVQSA